MILLTRLNGVEIYINPDLIERIEATPDTVLTLVDGKKYVAREEPRELIQRIVAFRASVLVMAEAESGLDSLPAPHAAHHGHAASAPRPLRLIDDHHPDHPGPGD